jgi:hypothetical protein
MPKTMRAVTAMRDLLAADHGPYDMVFPHDRPEGPRAVEGPGG